MLCFRKFLVAKKLLDKGGGGRGEHQEFSSNFFCLTVPKNFVGGSFSASESFGYRKKICLRGEYHDFLSKIFVS